MVCSCDGYGFVMDFSSRVFSVFCCASAGEICTLGLARYVMVPGLFEGVSHMESTSFVVYVLCCLFWLVLVQLSTSEFFFVHCWHLSDIIWLFWNNLKC